MHKKLFIPGPSEVGPEILATLATPQIGHRSGEFSELYASVHGKLRTLLKTDAHIYLSTSSATGVMEGAVRNLVSGRVLHLTCGAFSERWHQISVANGKEADRLAVEWGRPNLPETVEQALCERSYDAVALVHNETSTGVMNPLREISEVVQRHPDTLLVVDAVSSMAVVDLPFDELGVDLMFAGLQKGFGLPSGLTVFAVSEGALERARAVKDRGYYFDIVEFEKYHQRNQTPTTSCTPLFYGLDSRLDGILEMGVDRWFARHLEMAERCRSWARERFELFAAPGHESVSLTAVRNTKKMSIKELNGFLAERGMMLSNGYGKLKEETFRIGHMGDLGIADLETLLAAVDEYIDDR